VSGDSKVKSAGSRRFCYSQAARLHEGYVLGMFWTLLLRVVQYHKPSNNRANLLAGARSPVATGYTEEMKTIVGGIAAG